MNKLNASNVLSNDKMISYAKATSIATDQNQKHVNYNNLNGLINTLQNIFNGAPKSNLLVERLMNTIKLHLETLSKDSK